MKKLGILLLILFVAGCSCDKFCKQMKQNDKDIKELNEMIKENDIKIHLLNK